MFSVCDPCSLRIPLPKETGITIVSFCESSWAGLIREECVCGGVATKAISTHSLTPPLGKASAILFCDKHGYHKDGGQPKCFINSSSSKTGQPPKPMSSNQCYKKTMVRRCVCVSPLLGKTNRQKLQPHSHQASHIFIHLIYTPLFFSIETQSSLCNFSSPLFCPQNNPMR